MVGGTDPDELKFSSIMRITGADERFAVDVVEEDGQKRLATTATVSVRQVSGTDNFADNWFWIGDKDNCSTITAGDTFRVQIAAGCDPVQFPAVDVTYTVVPADVAAALPEIEVAGKIAAALNNNSTFNQQWRAQRILNNGIVHIASRFSGERGERLTTDAFLVTTTGTATALRAFELIERRPKVNSLTVDPTDPRTGTLGISGSVNFTPGTISNLFFFDCRTLGGTGSNLMSVNGSVTPVTFAYEADPTFDFFITEIVLHGTANGIQFTKFLNLNTILTNGLLFDIKSDNEQADLPVLRSTDDIKARFASINGFELDVQSGSDHFRSTRDFGLTPIVIRKQNSFGVGNNDFFRVTVRDNLSQILSLYCTLNGFRREF